MPKAERQELQDVLVQIDKTAILDTEYETSWLIRSWLRAKALQKEAESLVGDKGSLKAHMKMLVPVGQTVRTFKANGNQEVVVEICTRDLRKPDPALLTALAVKHQFPPEAYEQVVKPEFIAVALGDGRITQDEVKACLGGSVISYPTCNLREAKTDDDG